MDKISVCIPTYKSPQSLDLLLQSLIEGADDEYSYEILVGVDGTYEFNKHVLDKYKNNIKTLILETNHGLCRNTNLLVYNASCPLVLIVNDDNVAPLNWDVKLLSMWHTLEKMYAHTNIILTPNQIEPKPSIYPQFNIKDLGDTVESFTLQAFWDYEKSIFNNTFEHTGGTLPIFMAKDKYLALGGWDENYPTNGMVADYDFFYKATVLDFKMIRTYNCHFYHFASMSVNGNSRQQAEMEGYNYAKYKWGSYIYSHKETNKKFIL